MQHQLCLERPTEYRGISPFSQKGAQHIQVLNACKSVCTDPLVSKGDRRKEAEKTIIKSSF